MELLNRDISISQSITTGVTFSSQVFFADGARGLTFILDVTALGAGTNLTMKAQGLDPQSGKFWSTTTGITANAVGTWVLKYYPGLNPTVVGNFATYSTSIARMFNVIVTPSNANNSTYSIGATLLV